MFITMAVLFGLAVLAVLIVWGWFIFLGFHTSTAWAIALIFLYPLSPIVFVYRYERKTRNTVYPFLGSLGFLALVLLMTRFAMIDFFPQLIKSIDKALPRIEKTISNNIPETPAPVAVTPTEEVKPEPPANIPEPDKPTPEITSDKKVKTRSPMEKPKSQSYHKISLDEISHYLNREITVTTGSSAVLIGKLIAVDANELTLKVYKSGGSMTMAIKRANISLIKGRS